MDTISDKKFLMMFAVVMAVLTLIGVTVAILANILGSPGEYRKSNAQIELAAERIAPVGQVNLASKPTVEVDTVVAVAGQTKTVATPESLYNSVCAACHASGIAGAPKFADKTAWSARVGKGLDGLTDSAVNGIGNMPARGGSSLSDDEIKSVVKYMLDAL